jgi:hypothetical protein
VMSLGAAISGASTPSAQSLATDDSRPAANTVVSDDGPSDQVLTIITIVGTAGVVAITPLFLALRRRPKR